MFSKFAAGFVMACESSYAVKINVEGRCWEKATGVHKAGGDWLVGRCIRVFYDKEKAWFPGIVTGYRPGGAKDVLQAAGPVHDISYEDGSYLENLSTGKWEYDACEGAAGEFWEDAGVKSDESTQNLQSVDSSPSSSIPAQTKKQTTAAVAEFNGHGTKQADLSSENSRPQRMRHAPAQFSQAAPPRPVDSKKEKSIADSFVVVKSASKSKETKLVMPLQGTILLGKVKGYPWWPAKVLIISSFRQSTHTIINRLTPPEFPGARAGGRERSGEWASGAEERAAPLLLRFPEGACLAVRLTAAPFGRSAQNLFTLLNFFFFSSPGHCRRRHARFTLIKTCNICSKSVRACAHALCAPGSGPARPRHA
jgi:hypothetical protein